MGKQLVAPSQGGGLPQFADYVGKLFVIEPLGFETDIHTANGDRDAVRANVFVLLGPDKTDEFIETLIFPLVLIGQLRREVGSVVVGRLTQGDAKKGQNPPWKLADPTPKDMEKAAKFWTARSIAAPSSDEYAPDDNSDFTADDGDEDDAY